MTGCGGSIRLDARPVEELRSALAQPPAALVLPCDDPIILPDGPLNAGPAERGWIIDRFALLTCGDRLAALRRFYEIRDAGLAGAAQN